MNLTNTLGSEISILEKLKPIGLPIAVLALMVMMVIPLPSFLLDIFFTTNILLSLLIFFCLIVIISLITILFLRILKKRNTIQKYLLQVIKEWLDQL